MKSLRPLGPRLPERMSMPIRRREALAFWRRLVSARASVGQPLALVCRSPTSSDSRVRSSDVVPPQSGSLAIRTRRALATGSSSMAPWVAFQRLPS